jgi:hypothetical protein
MFRHFSTVIFTVILVFLVLFASLFTIQSVLAQQGDIAFLSPQAGDVWTKGDSRSIRWTLPDIPFETSAGVSVQEAVGGILVQSISQSGPGGWIIGNVRLDQGGLGWSWRATYAAFNRGTPSPGHEGTFEIDPGDYYLLLMSDENRPIIRSDIFTIAEEVSFLANTVRLELGAVDESTGEFIVNVVYNDPIGEFNHVHLVINFDSSKIELIDVNKTAIASRLSLIHTPPDAANSNNRMIIGSTSSFSVKEGGVIYEITMRRSVDTKIETDLEFLENESLVKYHFRPPSNEERDLFPLLEGMHLSIPASEFSEDHVRISVGDLELAVGETGVTPISVESLVGPIGDLNITAGYLKLEFTPAQPGEPAVTITGYEFFLDGWSVQPNIQTESIALAFATGGDPLGKDGVLGEIELTATRGSGMRDLRVSEVLLNEGGISVDRQFGTITVAEETILVPPPVLPVHLSITEVDASEYPAVVVPVLLYSTAPISSFALELEGDNLSGNLDDVEDTFVVRLSEKLSGLGWMLEYDENKFSMSASGPSFIPDPEGNGLTPDVLEISFEVTGSGTFRFNFRKAEVNGVVGSASVQSNVLTIDEPVQESPPYRFLFVEGRVWDRRGKYDDLKLSITGEAPHDGGVKPRRMLAHLEDVRVNEDGAYKALLYSFGEGFPLGSLVTVQGPGLSGHFSGFVSALVESSTVEMLVMRIFRDEVFTLKLNEGINLASFPVWQRGMGSALVNNENADFILRQTSDERFRTIFQGDPFGEESRAGEGLVVVMNAPAEITFVGREWLDDGMLYVPISGMNLLGVPMPIGSSASLWGLWDAAEEAGLDPVMVGGHNTESGFYFWTPDYHTPAMEGKGYPYEIQPGRGWLLLCRNTGIINLKGKFHFGAPPARAYAGEVVPIHEFIALVDLTAEEKAQVLAMAQSDPKTRLLLMPPPEKTMLLPNFPNPFNPETWIPYRLAKDADVMVSIYDSRGNMVRTIDVGHHYAGHYDSRETALYWNGRNVSGEQVASGVYFYQILAGDFSATRKMVILK